MSVRLFSSVALGALLVGGCQIEPNPRPIGPAPVGTGTAAEFSALVPVPTGPLHCEIREEGGPTADTRVISLVRDAKVSQRISVVLDPDGVPTRYMDVRGDIHTSGDIGGDRTTIGLFLTEGYAVLGNRASGAAPELIEVPLEQALEAPGLDIPSRQLERVLSECGQAI